jgi:hypothetical protein
VAECVPDMFVKNNTIGNNLTTAEAREENKHIFGISKILEKF